MAVWDWFKPASNFVLLIVPRRYFCGGSFCFMSWCLKFLCCWRLLYVFIFLVYVTEWPPIGKIAAHSAYDMFSWYKYLIVNLVFSHLGFWSGNLFLVAPFPDLCLLVVLYFFPHAYKIPFIETL